MNPQQQRARHSAVAGLAARQDDLDLVVTALAKGIVDARDARDAAIRRLTVQLDDLRAAVRDRDTAFTQEMDRRAAIRDRDTDQLRAELAEAFLAFEHQTFWQRLRWVVRGAAR